MYSVSGWVFRKSSTNRLNFRMLSRNITRAGLGFTETNAIGIEGE